MNAKELIKLLEEVPVYEREGRRVKFYEDQFTEIFLRNGLNEGMVDQIKQTFQGLRNNGSAYKDAFKGLLRSIKNKKMGQKMSHLLASLAIPVFIGMPVDLRANEMDDLINSMSNQSTSVAHSSEMSVEKAGKLLKNKRDYEESIKELRDKPFKGGEFNMITGKPVTKEEFEKSQQFIIGMMQTSLDEVNDALNKLSPEAIKNAEEWSKNKEISDNLESDASRLYSWLMDHEEDLNKANVALSKEGNNPFDDVSGEVWDYFVKNYVEEGKVYQE